MSIKVKKIGLLTSGGDAPGMNAAIRAVVRSALTRGLQVEGIDSGYLGLVEGNFRALDSKAVGGILQKGGTILGSSRFPKFNQSTFQQQALKNLKARHIDALIVIGGNGSQAGADTLSRLGFPVLGLASTIDNDLVGSDITIGADTALNVILESIDRLKVTASSHRRAIVVEVMGRDCGYLALMAGLASGAEAILIPEQEESFEEILSSIKKAYASGKNNALIVVAEGSKHSAQKLREELAPYQADLGFKVRFTILGHVQRGGVPTLFDRVLASRLGAKALELLSEGKHGLLVGLQGKEILATPLAEVQGKQKPLNLELLRLCEILV
ncbi:MAG: 6-phosphofructokinase [Deltaproteobacteria bacterium]|nr:6-phosphofructokinase [Deltaproteobacteria bacterium]